jgi:hypothetical protein
MFNKLFFLLLMIPSLVLHPTRPNSVLLKRGNAVVKHDEKLGYFSKRIATLITAILTLSP